MRCSKFQITFEVCGKYELFLNFLLFVGILKKIAHDAKHATGCTLKKNPSLIGKKHYSKNLTIYEYIFINFPTKYLTKVNKNVHKTKKRERE